jgi:hypothetical protein
MKALPYGTRGALQLRELDERSTEETAQIISVNSVKVRLFHGRKKLSERLRRFVEPSFTSENSARSYAAGQPVEIKVDLYARTWQGRVTNLGASTGSVFSLLPPENATGNYVKVMQRVPVRIDFDRVPGETLNAEGLLKPGLSVEPDVKVR